tara:strand:+ start:638 stop:943 length:306 start_codon:yes stop_codon:yes gene_type:complete
MPQMTRKHIEVRPSTDIPFFAQYSLVNQVAYDPLNSIKTQRGILQKGYEESEDGLTRTSVTTFKSGQHRKDYHERESIQAYQAAREAYNAEHGITYTEEDF